MVEKRSRSWRKVIGADYDRYRKGVRNALLK
jgi:hypothetical protein